MGGRDQRRPDRESWIGDVSDSRLATYERMISSPAAAVVRTDGSIRVSWQRQYFRDLVRDEIKKRRGS